MPEGAANPDTTPPISPQLIQGAAFITDTPPQVILRISLGDQPVGDIVVELDPDRAPVSVARATSKLGPPGSTRTMQAKLG